jgi:hypothetical protein
MDVNKPSVPHWPSTHHREVKLPRILTIVLQDGLRYDARHVEPAKQFLVGSIKYDLFFLSYYNGGHYWGQGLVAGDKWMKYNDLTRVPWCNQEEAYIPLPSERGWAPFNVDGVDIAWNRRYRFSCHYIRSDCTTLANAIRTEDELHDFSEVVDVGEKPGRKLLGNEYWVQTRGSRRAMMKAKKGEGKEKREATKKESDGEREKEKLREKEKKGEKEEIMSEEEKKVRGKGTKKGKEKEKEKEGPSDPDPIEKETGGLTQKQKMKLGGWTLEHKGKERLKTKMQDYDFAHSNVKRSEVEKEEDRELWNFLMTERIYEEQEKENAERKERMKASLREGKKRMRRSVSYIGNDGTKRVKTKKVCAAMDLSASD